MILIMRKHPRHRLAQKRDVKRVGQIQRQRGHQIMAGKALHPREKLLREKEVLLPKNRPLGMVGVAGGKTEGVFQDELEGGAGGFRDVQKDNHSFRPTIIGV